MAGGGKRENAGRPPGSRNKVTAENGRRLTELAAPLTPEMLEILVSIARDETTSPVARITAAVAVLDRGNGKPMQSHEFGGRDGKPIQIAPVINLLGKPDLPDDGRHFMTPPPASASSLRALAGTPSASLRPRLHRGSGGRSPATVLDRGYGRPMQSICFGGLARNPLTSHPNSQPATNKASGGKKIRDSGSFKVGRDSDTVRVQRCRIGLAATLAASQSVSFCLMMPRHRFRSGIQVLIPAGLD
jgi:hypothetical protein